MKLFSRTALAGAMAIGLAISSPAFAADYTIDTDGMHASINFRTSHLGFSMLTGRFDTFSGMFSFDKDKPAQSRVSVEIDTTSIDSNHAKRDEHLRSADFFDVANHPTARFESTAVEVTGENTARITGNLTLRGVTKPVTLEATYINEGQDPWGGYRAGFSATGEIVPADFGMPHLIAKGPVSLMIEAEGVRK